MAIVYLIHFDKPIGSLTNPLGHAQHYIGYTDSLKRRIKEHQQGIGCRILQVVNEQGIAWKVVRTWSDGTRALERKLKNRKNAPRLCPICRNKK